MDNLSTGRIRNLEASLASGWATFVFCDVAADARSLRDVLKNTPAGKIDSIFHLASPASPEAYGKHPMETLAVNALGTLSLIDIALEHEATLVYASTSEIYGDPLVHPQPESYYGNVDPVGIRACYDEGKRFGEAAVSSAVRSLGLDARIVRFFNCYGPRMDIGDGRLIPALMDAALAGRPFPIQGSGKQTRSMTYVDDAVDLLLLVATTPQTALQPVNIGSDVEKSVIEIAEEVARVAGVECELEFVDARPGDPQRRKPVLDVASTYGWGPSTSLKEGLERTLHWFTSERHAYA